MKRIICSLLVFCLLLPALAFAAPSQKLQSIYDSVDTLNVEELVALQDYVNAKIDASSAINTDETTYVLNKNTKKFHYADCASAKSIKDKNRMLRRALLVTPRAFRVTSQNLLNMQKAARFMQRAAFSFMRFFTPFQASDCRSSPPFHRRDRTVPCSPSL